MSSSDRVDQAASTIQSFWKNTLKKKSIKIETNGSNSPINSSSPMTPKSPKKPKPPKTEDEAAKSIQKAYRHHHQNMELKQVPLKKKTPHEKYLMEMGLDQEPGPEFSFNTRPGDVFSPLNAYWLARASLLVYYDKEVVEEEVLKGWKFDACKFIDYKDTQVFVALNRKIRNADGTFGKLASENSTGEDVDQENLILVVWRGTESKVDVMTDLMMSLVPGPYGKIHKGFKKAFLLVWQQVLDTIVEFMGGEEELHKDPDALINPRSTSIWVSGHSLGAALATLTSAYLLKDNVKVDGLYTFGQPRVGNDEFCQTLDKSYLRPRHYRFVNRADRVPRMPSRNLGFSHCGTLLFFDEEGGLFDTFALNHNADHVLSSTGFGTLVSQSGKDIGAWKSKYDHSITNYVKRMNKNVDTILLQVPMLAGLASLALDSKPSIPEPLGPAPTHTSDSVKTLYATLRRSNSSSPRTGTPPIEGQYLMMM